MKNRILFVAAIKEEIDFSFYNSYSNFDYLYTGIGKVNSAIMLMKYLSQITDHNINVINLGTCGSDNYKIGEVISVLGCSEYGSDFISQNINLQDISYKIPFPTRKDFILSSDFFVSLQTMNDDNFSKFKAQYHNFDMEAAALAKVCRCYNIPFSSIKIVSDNLNSKISDWENILSLLSPKLEEIAVSILKYDNTE